MKTSKTGSALLLLFFLLAAVVLSALVSHFTEGISWLEWLTWGDSLGFDTVNLDLVIVQLSFAFKMQVNVLQILLIGAGLLCYKKVR